MSEFWKKTLFWGAVGFVLGMLVSLGFLLPMGIAQYYARHGSGRLALQLLAGGALGAINMGSTSIYSLERWSLLRCTLTHFCIAMTTYFTVGFSMGWIRLGDAFTLWLSAIMVVVYFIIWLIMYLQGKRDIRKINEALKRWKDEQGIE